MWLSRFMRYAQHVHLLALQKACCADNARMHGSAWHSLQPHLMADGNDFWLGMIYCPQQALALGHMDGEDAEGSHNEERLENDGGERHPVGDLSREAAHNLVMIYKATGAMELAVEVMHRYLRI